MQSNESTKTVNRQRTFNRVVRGLLKQGRRSTFIDKDGYNECAFRGSDGCRSPAGFLIPSDAYNPAMEGHHVLDLASTDWFGHDLSLVKDLERIHDCEAIKHWKRELLRVGKKFNLDTTLVEKIKCR